MLGERADDRQVGHHLAGPVAVEVGVVADREGVRGGQGHARVVHAGMWSAAAAAGSRRACRGCAGRAAAPPSCGPGRCTLHPGSPGRAGNWGRCCRRPRARTSGRDGRDLEELATREHQATLRRAGRQELVGNPTAAQNYGDFLTVIAGLRRHPIVDVMGISREDPKPLKPPTNAIFLWWFLWRSGRRGLNAEHPVVVPVDGMSDHLRVLAVRVAADIPDDAEAVPAIRAAGGKSKNWKIAAASMRADGYTRVSTVPTCGRPAFFKAAADDGLPVPLSSEEEALFRAVESLEALPLEDAFAVLASEVPGPQGTRAAGCQLTIRPGMAGQRRRRACPRDYEERGPARWPETTRRIAIDPLTRGTRARKRLPAR